jgi:hypothetical protein
MRHFAAVIGAALSSDEVNCLERSAAEVENAYIRVRGVSTTNRISQTRSGRRNIV